MSKVIPKDNLANYTPWELPNVDEPTAEASDSSTESAAETPRRPPRPSASVSANLPTLEEIETIQREAQEEGFAAGYQEGRREGREQGHRKGHQEGHEEGYRKGLEEGLAAGQAELAQRVETLDKILGFLGNPLQELDAEVEQELAYLATEIARQLVRRELKAAPGEVVAVVREAVSLLPVATQGVRIHLHPEDVRIIRDALAIHDEAPHWKLLEDPTLTRGGCVVNTDLSRIDASVEKRLRSVIATVLGDERVTSG